MLHPKSVPIFYSKLGEEQKKGLHSNLVPLFAQSKVQAKNKRLRQLFVCSKLLPKKGGGHSNKKGGHAAILHTAYANYTILATQKGGHGPMAPLNTPLPTGNQGWQYGGVRSKFERGVLQNLPYRTNVT